MTASSIPAAVKHAYRQRRLRFHADYPDRRIVDPSPRFIPAPTVSGKPRRARKLKTVWVSSFSDNGSTIVLDPYRELYDDPQNGIWDLTDWHTCFGDGSNKRPKRADRGDRSWERRREPELTHEEMEAKRREVARRLFPKMDRKVRKLFFSKEVQGELVPVLESMVRTAIVEHRINDCSADREDYARTIQYMMYAIAAKYDEARPGNENRETASLVTFIKDCLVNRELDMKRSRYAIKRLGDLFVVPIENGCDEDVRADSEAFTMVTAEALEDTTRRQHDSDDILDIEAVEKRLEYVATHDPRRPLIKKAFMLLVYDDLDVVTAAKKLGVTREVFRSRYLEKIRETCISFGFCPKSKAGRSA